MPETEERPPVPQPVVGEFTLPSGGTINLRDPEDLTGADHRAIMSGIHNNPDKDAQLIGAAMDMVYGMACMLIESWDIPYLPGKLPPSKAPDTLGMLRLRDYRAVLDVTAPAMDILFPGEPTVDDAQVQGSPTGPASA